MKTIRTWAVALAALAASAGALAQEINFGVIATDAAAAQRERWEPFFRDMEKKTGLKIRSFYAPDYAGVIEAMRFNKVQVAWYGNKSAIEAVDRSGGEVFAKTVGVDGTEGYYSLLVVHKDSPLKSLADVIANRAKLQLGFGDPNSTSGTVIPGYYAFGLNKIDPVKDFKRTVRANHETNLLAVVTRQVDVATNNNENWERFSRTHPEKIKEVREIWRSPLIPSDPIVWRKDLDPAVKQKVRDFLLGYGRDEHSRKVLANPTMSGFRASSDRQLDTIRQIELVKARTKVEHDAKLSDADRAARLREIDAKLATLRDKIAQK